MFLAQLATLAVGTLVLQRVLGPWEDVGPPALKRLIKHEDAPLLPFVNHIHNMEKQGRKAARTDIKEAHEQHR